MISFYIWSSLSSCIECYNFTQLNYLSVSASNWTPLIMLMVHQQFPSMGPLQSALPHSYVGHPGVTSTSQSHGGPDWSLYPASPSGIQLGTYRFICKWHHYLSVSGRIFLSTHSYVCACKAVCRYLPYYNMIWSTMRWDINIPVNSVEFYLQHSMHGVLEALNPAPLYIFW